MRLLTVMKRILSFLLSVVFLHVQTAPLMAKRGGPDIGGSSNEQNVDIVGTYSGTLIPTNPEAAGTPALDGGFVNSLGLFSLGMPLQGPGTGSFVIFTQGVTFTGTITAVGDPGKGTISGLVEGTYDFSDFVFFPDGSILVDQNGVPVIQDFTATITGTLFATVLQNADFNPNDPASFGTSFQRIEGTAQMGVLLRGDVADRVLDFIVDGVKQTVDVGNAGGLTGGATTP
jgi:hypothetical protein